MKNFFIIFFIFGICQCFGEQPLAAAVAEENKNEGVIENIVAAIGDESNDDEQHARAKKQAMPVVSASSIYCIFLNFCNFFLNY